MMIFNMVPITTLLPPAGTGARLRGRKPELRSELFPSPHLLLLTYPHSKRLQKQESWNVSQITFIGFLLKREIAFSIIYKIKTIHSLLNIFKCCSCSDSKTSIYSKYQDNVRNKISALKKVLPVLFSHSSIYFLFKTLHLKFKLASHVY